MPRRRPYIRPKTIRRLLILAAIAGVAGGSVGVAFMLHRRADDQRVAASRAAGMTAFAHGDYAAAQRYLEPAVAAQPNDADALFSLAAAEVALDPQNRAALVDARTRLEQLLRLDSTHDAARHKLLELYERTGLSPQMLDLASALLQSTPRDAAALRGRALALSRLNRDAEALPAWQAYVASTPADVRGQLQLIAAMRRTGSSPEALVAHAQHLADANPGDPRYRLPLAEVLREAGRDADALALLRSLSASPPKDDATILELVNALDRSRAFDDAEHLLASAADTLGSGIGVTSALVERIWQAGRTQQVISVTDRLLSAGRRDAALLALRAIALAAVNRRDEAKPLIDELALRKDDPSAAAWAEALAPDFAAKPPSPAERLQALRSATLRDPSNAIARLWLARALVAIGEPDAAAVQYREAAQRVPSWATPCIELAETARASGRFADAIAAAKAAILRSPNSPAAQVIAARVRFDTLDAASDSGEDAALLGFVAALRVRLPDEPTLAPIHIALLARNGRADDACMLLQTTLARTPSAAMLAELYAVDHRFQLGQGEMVIARASAAGMLTPQLLLRRALDLASDGKAPLAIALVSAQLAAHPADAAWALVDARIRSRANDAGAADAWAKLLAQHGNDLGVVTAAIDDDAPLRGGRPAMAELIERLRTLGGGDANDASGYRLRRATFLANSPDVQEVRQALSLASDLVRQQPSRPELRLLLARVLVKLDNVGTALEHLRSAYEAAPADAAIGLELATLLRHEGRLDEALPVLRRIATTDATSAMSDAALVRVASELLEVGLSEVAAQMLARAERRHTLDPDGRLAYAEALRASGDTAGAANTFERLTSDAKAKPAAISAAATFARSDGRADQANLLLARLAAMPGSLDRDRALARFHAAFDETDAARAAYAAALNSAPDAGVACEAIAFELAHDAADRADQILAVATARFPNDAALQRARLELAARKHDGSHALDALIAALAADPASKAEADALAALRDASANGSPSPALADAMTRLAARYPSSTDLARLAIDANLNANRPDTAAALAHRLAADQPTVAQAQACAARALAACGQRSAARRAAERWRSLDPASGRDADTLLARLALDEHDPARASALLTPYRGAIDATRDADQELVIALARTLSANGQTADAFGLLAPATPSKPTIRAAWLELCTEPSAAVGRLTELLAATPSEADDERLRLANACLTLASVGREGAAALGLRAIDPVVARSGAKVASRVLRGELLRVSGDLGGAEAAFRDALRNAPDDPAAKNSLAFVLLAAPPTSPARAEEASKLAREAATLRPRQADVRDTLARAEWAAGRIDQATRAFREALALDPTCLDAMLGLAALNASTGKLDEANRMLPGIEQRLTGTPVPIHLRRDMQSLREALSTARD